MWNVGLQALSAAAAVLVVSQASRRLGRGAAGLLAGLPVISLPTLCWLAQAQGPAFAAQGARGGLVACVLAPPIGCAMALLLQRVGVTVALAGTLALWGLMLPLMLSWSPPPIIVGALVVLAAGLTLRQLGRRRFGPVPMLRWRGEPWWGAALAAASCVGIGLAAPALGPRLSGTLSALPLISMVSMTLLQRVGQGQTLPRFAHGYTLGIVSKAACLAVFAQALPGLGLTAAAALGIASGAVVSLALGWLTRPRAGAAAPLPADAG